jgi:hypothetical protein
VSGHRAETFEHISRMGDVSNESVTSARNMAGQAIRRAAQEEISMPSKMIVVAYYYDALTSDRPSGKTLSKEKAPDIMRKLIGMQCDPAVFEYFEKVLPDSAPCSALDGRGIQMPPR